MAEADKDGRMAQIVSDLHATLAMSLNEWALDVEATFSDLLDEDERRGDDE